MADEEQRDVELTDEEIADLANKELRKRDEEIAKLKKELNVMKLYSKAEEEEREVPTREECLKTITDNRTSNYDYAQAIVDLCEIEKNEGRPNPLGSNGERVVDFFKDVIDECDGDKSRFPSVYQAKLGNDDPQIALKYSRLKK